MDVKNDNNSSVSICLNNLMIEDKIIDENDFKINNEAIFKAISYPVYLYVDGDIEEDLELREFRYFRSMIMNTKIFHSYKKGMSINRISEKYGLSTIKVHHIIREMNGSSRAYEE